MIKKKKLIAIAVVFVLAVGVAFSQVSVSGQVSGGINLMEGSSEADAEVGASGNMTVLRLTATGQDDDGKFGGYLRIDKGPWWAGITDVQFAATGYAWWQPIEQFKVQFGGNGKDGFFGADGQARWQFYQVANDSTVVSEAWNYSSSFYQGFDPLAGAVFTIKPIEAMEINIGVPFGGTSNSGGDTAKNMYSHTNAQLAYNIGGIGKVAVTYKGDMNNYADYGNGNGSTLFGYFELKAIENLEIDLGVGYILPVKDETTDFTYRAPVAVGLAVKFDAGALGIKARLQGKFGEVSKPVVGDEVKGNTNFVFDLLPSFAINDKVSALLSAGINMTSYSADGVDNTVGWHINPYVTVKSNWWAPNLYAGVRFWSDGATQGNDAVVNWSIPVGIVYAF
jgi:hypothetical protein